MILSLVAGTQVSCAVSKYMARRDMPNARALGASGIDVEASEIDIQTANGRATLPPGVAMSLRADVAKGIAAAMSTEGTVPARFRLRVTSDNSIWPMYACLVLLTWFGCPIAVVTTDGSFDLDLGDEHFVTSVSQRTRSGYYYNMDPVQAGIAAVVGDALDKFGRERRARATHEAGR